MEIFMPLRANASLAQQCFDQLQAEIVEGILKPGEKLKVEPLKERFGTAQSAVREALSRLVAVGLVDAEENRGFRVASISEADIRDVYAIFTAIELMALEQAIARGDYRWEAGIVAALHTLALVEKKSPADSYAVWAERNYAFHLALIAGCGSPSLLDLRKRMYLKFDRYCRIAYRTTQKTLHANHKEHERLARTVLARDVATAQQLMHHHINDALEGVIQTLKRGEML